jgi:hypothetical protein
MMSIRRRAGRITDPAVADGRDSSAPIATPGALASAFEAALANDSQRPAEILAAFGPGTIRLCLHGFPRGTAYGRALRPARSDRAVLFTIHVIDGEACAMERPRLAWSVGDFGPKRVVPGWSDEAFTTYLLRGEGGIALADWDRSRAFVWLPSHTALPWYEHAAPLRWLFDRLARRIGLSSLHAAAVGLDGLGILIAGGGGAGKSTLSLACLEAGFDYIGDDYCLLSHADHDIFALYSTAKWDREAKVRPGWPLAEGAHMLAGEAPKNVAFLEGLRPQALADRMAIAAIVLPAIGAEAQPVLEPVGAQVALRSLSASSLAQSESGEPELVAALARLVRSVPAYRLHMTARPAENAAALRTLLEGLRR